VESTRAGRSEESPVGSGPGADCGFATPRRKASPRPNAVERIIIHISPTVRGRPRGSLGGPGGLRLSPRLSLVGRR
jgi:hypothetical protein